MAVTISDAGRNNFVDAPAEFLRSQIGTIAFTGNNGHVRIGERNRTRGFRFLIGQDCRFQSDDDVWLGQLAVFMRSGSRFSIGADTGFTGHTTLHAHEAFDITIGRGCLIAAGTALSVSDMHSILSLETGERLNPGASIVLEDRVWLGDAVRVLKGVRIGTGSVVAAGAIVTHDIPAHSVAAGVPASVVRDGIEWVHELV